MKRFFCDVCGVEVPNPQVKSQRVLGKAKDKDQKDVNVVVTWEGATAGTIGMGGGALIDICLDCALKATNLKKEVKPDEEEVPA